MQKLIPKRPSEDRATFLDDTGIYEFWLDRRESGSPSITVVEEDVVDACDPGDWCSDYVGPDGRMIRGRIRTMIPGVSIPSWQAALERPAAILVRLRL